MISPAQDNTPRGPVARLARLVLAHRRLVILAWALMLPVGILAAGQVSKRLSIDFSLPGQPGYEAAQKITRLYGNGGDTVPTVIVVTVPAGQTVRGERAQLTRAFDRARAAAPRSRIVDLTSTGDRRFITANGRTTFAIIYTRRRSFSAPATPRAVLPAVSSALPGADVQATGLNQLASGGSSKGPGVLAETLIGAAGVARGARVRVRVAAGVPARC